MFRKRKLPSNNQAVSTTNNHQPQSQSEQQQGTRTPTSSKNPTKPQDLWESNRLRSSGALIQRHQHDPDFEDDKNNDDNLSLTTHKLTPPFLKDLQDASTKVNLGKGNGVISPVRDPTSDLAQAAKKGSLVVRERRAVKERKDKDSDSLATQRTQSDTTENNHQDFEEEEVQDGTDEKKLTPQEQRLTLPAYQHRSSLLKIINENQVSIIIGQTGSGKTTQLPQIIYESLQESHSSNPTSIKMIGITQPRRVAATSIAKRVAEETSTTLGSLVGYAVRFEDETSKDTKIKYMTDGILLREMAQDPDLSKYSHIIMDEAHERSLNTDILLGLLRLLLSKGRPDLKLIITSATMDQGKFTRFFGDAPVYIIPGRTFPVTVKYADYCCDDYVESAVKEVMKVHLANDVEAGDILVFMTGQEDIETCCQLIQEKIDLLNRDVNDDEYRVKPLDILPIYSSLPPEQQALIFKPRRYGHRKCIIATNIAETSLTVDGITYVIDCGFAKLKVYNASIGLESLAITPISAANAKQRAGRAGRTAPGTCIKLYTESAEESEMYQATIPEIQRTNLSNTLLLLKSLGIDDILTFPFLDPPPRQSIITSLYELWSLGALDNFGGLTKLGRKMTSFPLTPPLSKLLLLSSQRGCSEEMVIIVSMLSLPSPYLRPTQRQKEADLAREKFQVPESDHLSLLNVYQTWLSKKRSVQWCRLNFLNHRTLIKAEEIKVQLEQIMNSARLSLNSIGSDWSVLRECIAASFYHQSATLSPSSRSTYLHNLTGLELKLHPTSSLYDMASMPKFIVYHELLLTTKQFVSGVTAVNGEWLVKYGQVYFDEKRKDTGVLNGNKERLEKEIERDSVLYEERKANEEIERKLKKQKTATRNIGIANVGGSTGRRRRGF
ncbi:hypothetical protein WICPIJ_001060 [Wickerhamomyces pijperi]|uniref:Pre-mRNA-splicing factor ATP-dependent RNA helicase PRP16 n=1 Tax=Wickerhamomyces pijperi TaxID=599730 RepID=A0A9P8QE94_WICPI|nr:hypothetical protein WICPIJ_001060 [Wickerhamomyces pijperi]